MRRAARIDANVAWRCANCGIEARPTVHQMRKTYCSGACMSDAYKTRMACHLASGGARRAGEAAVMAKLKYGAKKDANHREIFAYIEVFTAVKDLSNAGCGVPDGLAWVSGGWRLFDVKNRGTAYGRRGLNPIQKRWADDWRGGPVYLIHDIEEAALFVKGEFGSLTSFPAPEVAA